MNKTDKLNPTALTDVANAWIPVLNKNIEHLSEIRSALDCFSSSDGTCKTFDVLWPIIEDYQLAITSDITASEFDIRDCNTLINSIGTEYLDGAVIISSKNSAKSDINYYSGMLDFNRDYRDNLEWWEIPFMYPIISGVILYYEGKLSSAQNEYDTWLAKENAFDSIELSTKNLFTDGQEFRALVQEGFTALGTAITSSGITYDYPTEWKTQLYDYEEGVINVYYNRYVHENNGQIEYDWDAISEFAQADPSTISREEYLAMARIMDDMSDEDLERLLNKNCWTTTDCFGCRCFHEGETIAKAAQYYLMIEQATAEVTIFNSEVNDALDDQQRAQFTNALTRAYMVNVVLNNPSPLANTYSITATPNSAGIVTYNVTIYENYNDTYVVRGNFAGPVATPPTSLDATICPVSHGSLLDRYTDDLTMSILNPCEDWSMFTVKAIAGFVIDNLIGLDTVCGLVVDIGHIGEDVVANINNYVQVSGIENLQEVESAMEHLGMSASIGNIDGFLTCNTVLSGVRFDPDELVIRLYVYQQETGTTLTEQDIRNALNGGDTDILKDYDDWYVEQGGEDKINTFRNNLSQAYASYIQEHPETSNFEDMTRQETNALIAYYENQ